MKNPVLHNASFRSCRACAAGVVVVAPQAAAPPASAATKDRLDDVVCKDNAVIVVVRREHSRRRRSEVIFIMVGMIRSTVLCFDLVSRYINSISFKLMDDVLKDSVPRNDKKPPPDRATADATASNRFSSLGHPPHQK